MAQIRKWLHQYREQLSYLFFGGVTTLVNILALEVLARLGLRTWLANAIAWVLSVLVAYFTNRRWVFHSSARGREALREFGAFVGCRLGTFALDEVIVVAGVDGLHLWRPGVKVFANILVILLNYVFSKKLIFRGKGHL